jgi:hypothetical protein
MDGCTEKGSLTIMSTETWHRFQLTSEQAAGDDISRLQEAMFTLRLGRPVDCGLSMWTVNSFNQVSSATLGLGEAKRAKEIPFDVTEVYLSPGTYELLRPMLGAYAVEPCEKPAKADVSLSMGDARDWDIWFGEQA